jgi:hypothetical protein
VAWRVADDGVTFVAGLVCMVQPAARHAIAMASTSSVLVRCRLMMGCVEQERRSEGSEAFRPATLD